MKQIFFDAYIEAINFTSCGPDDECQGACFATETAETIKADCTRFLALYGDAIAAMIDNKESLDADATGFFEHAGTESIWTQAGYDFWLTRCGHGTGFWDRKELYGDDLADKLTDAVGYGTKFPGLDCYLGDDGLIYFA